MAIRGNLLETFVEAQAVGVIVTLAKTLQGRIVSAPIGPTAQAVEYAASIRCDEV